MSRVQEEIGEVAGKLITSYADGTTKATYEYNTVYEIRPEGADRGFLSYKTLEEAEDVFFDEEGTEGTEGIELVSVTTLSRVLDSK
jgi:hypothetical protein